MTVLGLLATIALLLGNALFVAAEFAAVSARRAQLEPLAARSRRARHTLAAQHHLTLLLAGAQLGITLCSLGLGAIAEPTLGHLLEHALHAARLPVDLVDPLAFTAALALVVLAHMVLGEMVPKNLALAGAERHAVLLVPALATFVRLTRPLLAILNAAANAALRTLGVEPQPELKTAYSADELAATIAESKAEGLLTATGHDRLQRVLNLQQRTAADVLIPLDSLVTVSPRATTREVEALIARTGYSRLPIAQPAQPPKPPQLTGYLHAIDLLSPQAHHGGPIPDRIARPLPTIAESTPLQDVLTTLRDAGSHLAAVTDGDHTLGALALEDVLEHLTGEITDATHQHQPSRPFPR